MDYNTLYWLDDGISCLGILAGLGGAIFMFTRRKTRPAILALVGFLAMALHPLMDIVLYRLIANLSYSVSLSTLDYVYVCIAGPGFLLGAILITFAFISGFREPKPTSPAIDPHSTLPLMN
jgi:membrane-bound metal-dependent hydrolase YbcI (DUF457 family)